MSGDKRFLVKALALDIAADIHPINNLRVMQHLEAQFQLTNKDKQDWMRHWMRAGFSALEKKLMTTAGRFCVGDNVTLVDVCLVPQVYNARRFELDMTPYPTINRIIDNTSTIDAFVQAEPKSP